MKDKNDNDTIIMIEEIRRLVDSNANETKLLREEIEKGRVTNKINHILKKYAFFFETFFPLSVLALFFCYIALLIFKTMGESGQALYSIPLLIATYACLGSIIAIIRKC